VTAIGNLRLDEQQMKATENGTPISLSPLEYRLLAYLVHHRGRVITQLELTEHVYGQDYERESNAIEVLVGRVRRKLKTNIIETRRGFGYIVPQDLP
jgi:two-component system, OmpR family, response regulator